MTVTRKAVTKRWLLIFAPLFATVIGLSMFVYHLEVRADRQVLEGDERQLVELEREAIASEFRSIVSDVLYLAGVEEVLPVLENGPEGRSALGREYLTFSRFKGAYEQIRFLDLDGMEIVRVNCRGGYALLVPDDQLQDKRRRYYFEETARLERGEVYVSPFDLNVELGQVEEPPNPVIRFGTPAFDREGRKGGLRSSTFAAPTCSAASKG